MQYALYVVREVPTAGYLNYPWESILPNTAFVRSDANNNGYLDNGTLSNVNNLSNPTFANVDDSGQMHVLNDLAGNPIQNIPVHAPGGTADLTTNGYYTAYVEAVQGDADWNTTGGGGTPDLKFDQYDFDRYSLLLRARTVGLYGSIKDIVMVVRVVKPDGTPYGDEPGSTQGSGTGGSSWSSTVTW